MGSIISAVTGSGEGGGSDTSSIAGASGLAGGIWGEIDRQKRTKEDKEARRENLKQRDDLGNRREATYRADRQGIQGALDAYYQKQGWPIPERLPGYGTTKKLPFEASLYNKDGTANEQPLSPSYVDPQEEAPAAQVASNMPPPEVQGLAPQPTTPIQPDAKLIDPAAAIQYRPLLQDPNDPMNALRFMKGVGRNG